MYVSDILRDKGSRVVSLSADSGIADAAGLLTAEGIGALLVLDSGGGVAGIISERDMVQGLSRHGAAALSMRVGDLMTRDMVFCSPEDSIDDLMGLMTQRRVRHLPVLRNGQLVGIVSIGDVVKRRIDETEREAKALREYITNA